MGSGGHNRVNFHHNELSKVHITLSKAGINWKVLSQDDQIKEYSRLKAPVICNHPGCTNIVKTKGHFKCSEHAGFRLLAKTDNPAKRPEVKAKISQRLTGRNFSPEWRSRLSNSSFWKGKTKVVSDSTRNKLRKIQVDAWSGYTPEEKRLRLRSNATAQAVERPNYVERKLQSMLDQVLPGQYTYVGDFSILVGGKNPDFISTTGKKVIELFGEHWHEIEDEPNRIQHFKENGYDCLVLWAKELNKDDLTERLLSFHNK
jgi:very-short-patch-repair endonuclease